MKVIFIKAVRKVIYMYMYIHYYCKCQLFYFLLGGAGLSYVIENLPPSINIRILRKFGASIGKNCQIDTGLIIHRIIKKGDIKKLTIGEKVYIGHNMVLDLTEPVTIDSHCAFGANCQIWTHTGNWTNDRSDEKDITGPVIIKRSVIVYSGSIISQGLKIGNFSRVAAGSVVTKSVEDLVFVGGAPAKKIRDIKFDKGPAERLTHK